MTKMILQKLCGAVVLVFFTSSCIKSIDEKLIEILDCSIGKPVDALIQEIGIPSFSTKTHYAHYYSWLKETQKPKTVTGYHFKDPFVEIFAQSTGVREQEMPDIKDECKLLIVADLNDIVLSYKIKCICNKNNPLLFKS